MENTLFDSKYYFAAANGFDGFRSSFDGVFSPLELKKLFILKGGPGTGKSTLMRRVAKHFSNEATVTNILCSSDTHSLDGVLLERDGITVGIVDGTAPHVVEPRFPGAVEEIVNLGDGFDYGALAGAAKQIIELTQSKSASYKIGYSALKCAGEIYKCLDSILLDIGVYKEAELLALDMEKDASPSLNQAVDSRFLISAFSKDGYTRMPNSSEGKVRINIFGDGVTEYALMKKICEILFKRGAARRVHYSPLSPKMIDAVESDGYVYAVSDCETECIDTRSFAGDAQGYADMLSAYGYALNTARTAFAKASSYHFALEDIYSKSVFFESNESKKSRIIESINQLFNK